MAPHKLRHGLDRGVHLVSAIFAVLQPALRNELLGPVKQLRVVVHAVQVSLHVRLQIFQWPNQISVITSLFYSEITVIL